MVARRHVSLPQAVASQFARGELSTREVARLLGCSQPRAIKALQDAGLSTARRAPAAAVRCRQSAVVLTSNEHEALTGAAEKAGKSVSDLIRETLKRARLI